MQLKLFSSILALCLLLLAAVSFSGCAGNERDSKNNITVLIVDEDGNPVPEASIRFKPLGQDVCEHCYKITDSQGVGVFSDIPSGKYSVNVGSSSLNYGTLIYPENYDHPNGALLEIPSSSQKVLPEYLIPQNINSENKDNADFIFVLEFI
jgi:hypothetical protein